jgi:hypothetical protein
MTIFSQTNAWIEREILTREIDVLFKELKTFDFIRIFVLITIEFNKIISKRQQHVGKSTSSN